MRSVLPWNFNQNKKVVGGREGEGSCLVFTVKMVIPMSGRQQRTKHSAGQGMETFFFFFFLKKCVGRVGGTCMQSRLNWSTSLCWRMW